VCDKAGHELLTFDQQKAFRSPKLSVYGSELEEVAQEAERVDGRTLAILRHEPASPLTGAVLANLAHSRTELQAVVNVVRHHGSAFGRLPRGLVLRLLKANGGCFGVRLRPPISG
jgi:hypothetical protein